MRSVKQSSAFKKDLKREKKGINRHAIREEFMDIVTALAADKSLPQKYRDHVLVDNWSECGECRIRSNLLLIYKKTGDNVLHLLRLGSHSELFDL